MLRHFRVGQEAGPTLPKTLCRLNEFSEAGFIKDGDAEFLGFAVFRSGGFAGQQIIRLLAHAGAGSATGSFNHLSGFVAGQAGKSAGQDEGLSAEGSAACGLGVCAGKVYTVCPQAIDAFLMGGIGKPIDEALCHDGADAIDRFQLFEGGYGEGIE